MVVVNLFTFIFKDVEHVGFAVVGWNKNLHHAATFSPVLRYRLAHRNSDRKARVATLASLAQLPQVSDGAQL